MSWQLHFQTPVSLHHAVVPHRPGGRERHGRPIAQTKHGSVAGALDLFGLEIYFALGQRELFVAAAIVQDEDLFANPYSHQGATARFELARHALLEVTQLTDIYRTHAATTATLERTEATSRSTNSASSEGRADNIS